MPFDEHGIGPRGMRWAGMAGLVLSGGCLLSSGCLSKSEGDYVWSITWRTGLAIERDLEHSPEKRTRDEFEFKPQVANWLFNGQTPAPKEDTIDDVDVDGS